MTRKDYEIIAKAIAQAYIETKNTSETAGCEKTLEHITHALQIDNSRFQATRFRKYVFQVVMELTA